MDKEKMKKLAKDKDHIPGIYNYCDRWCERCPFTTRCLNYALADQQFPDPESRDMSNEKFWQNLSESFQAALDLLEEAAEREGIDLDVLDTDEQVEDRSKKDRRSRGGVGSRAFDDRAGGRAARVRRGRTCPGY